MRSALYNDLSSPRLRGGGGQSPQCRVGIWRALGKRIENP